MSSKSEGTRVGWATAVASVYTSGYCLAALPPIFVDPLLKSHISFPGGRHYHRTWLTILFAGIVALSTWVLAKRRSNPLVVGVPLVAGTFATNVFLFPQEFPYDHVLFVTAVWTSVCSIWIWIRYSADLACRMACAGDVTTVEYVKEQASFFRALAFGLVGAFLAMLVAALVAIHGANSSIVTNKAEAFLLQRLSDFVVAAYALLLLFCPVQEALHGWRRITLLLLPKVETQDTAGQQTRP